MEVTSTFGVFEALGCWLGVCASLECLRCVYWLCIIFALRVKQRQPEVGENVNRLYYVYGSNVNLWWFRVLLGVGCERFDSLFQTGWKQRQPFEYRQPCLKSKRQTSTGSVRGSRVSWSSTLIYRVSSTLCLLSDCSLFHTRVKTTSTIGWWKQRQPEVGENVNLSSIESQTSNVNR